MPVFEYEFGMFLRVKHPSRETSLPFIIPYPIVYVNVNVIKNRNCFTMQPSSMM